MTTNKNHNSPNVPNSTDKGNVIRNVPALRFPEFSGEWKREILNDVCTFHNGRAYKQNELLSDGKYRVLRVGNFFTNDSWYYSDLELDDEKVAVNGDLLYAWSASFGPRFWTGEKVIYHYHIWKIDSFQQVSKEFLFYFLERDTEKIKNEVQGGTMVHITKGDMEKREILYPSILEQSKIARLLSLLDERIATQNKIIERYESLIRGIMVELQKQGLKRGTWKKVFLNDILKERNERNSNLYQVFSVSVSQGIINQVDHLGRSFSAKDTSKYNVVHYGDLVYTKSPTGSFPYGIVKQSLNHESVAVSPLYGVYVPDSLAIGIYLHKYFMSEINTQNYLHPLIQKGAKNTINITNQHFLENRVPIPLDSNELLLISKLLRSLNDEIRHEQNMLQEYQKQKQYLLRQMFI